MATWDALLYLDVRSVIALALRLVIIYVCTPHAMWWFTHYHRSTFAISTHVCRIIMQPKTAADA